MQKDSPERAGLFCFRLSVKRNQRQLIAFSKTQGNGRREFLQTGFFFKIKQIGDIDLILKNDKNDYLLIEAKNHALPRDIYFKDADKTREHLHYLKENWEKKVLKRVTHLKANHLSNSIPSTCKYIVVSKYPEIISHFSDLLILSIQEYEVWRKDYSNF